MKIINFNIELKSTTPQRLFAREKAMTNDLNSVDINYKISDMTAEDLTDATAQVLLYMQDGSFFQIGNEKITLVGTTFTYTLEETPGNHAGIVKTQIVVKTSDSKEYASPKLEFEIVRGLEMEVASEIMIHDWTTLTREARAYLDEAIPNEQTRVDSELARVEAEIIRAQNAKDFAKAEALRVQAEGLRVEAESLRVTAENLREQNEATRQTTFNKSQVDRQLAYVDAENARDAAYGARVTALEEAKVKKYGVRRTLNATSPLLERLYDSVGLVANMPTDDSVVQNDFDNIYPYSHIKECIRDSTGRYHYKGEPSYTLAIGDYLVEIPKYYIKIEQTATYRDYVTSQHKLDGFWLPQAFRREDGTELDKIYVGQYKTGKVDTADVSRPDLVPENYRGLSSFRDAARAKGPGWQLIDISYVTEVLHILYLVEYASLFSQDKLGPGITTARYTASDTAQISESAVNRVVVLTTVANYFEVGQQIGIGTSLGVNNVADKRNITAINVVDGTTSEIVFDGAAVNIAVGNIVWNSAQKTGQTKNLTKPSSKLSGTSGKTSFKYRGLEDPFGNVLEWVDGILMNDWAMHVCRKPNLYASTLTADYKALNYTNKNGDGYPLELGFDNNYPEAQFPITTGAGTTTGYTDYYYGNNGGLRGAYFGGYANFGSTAGSFYWVLNHTPTVAHWNIGARLLFKPPVL